MPLSPPAMRRTVRIGARHILQDRPDSIEYFGPTLKSTPLGKTHWQYTHGVPQDRLDRIAPDAWQLDQAGLDRNGNDAIQLQLFWDYQFNLDSYPKFQEYFRTSQPPLLVVWGKNDEIFGAAGAEAFKRDLPGGEYHLLDAGHFALETHGEEISGHIRNFLGRL